MINRELKSAKVFRYTELDDYAQIDYNSPTDERTIEIAIGIYSHSPVADVRYSDCTHYGLTKEKDITDADIVFIDEDKKYKVISVNPYGRLTHLLLKDKF